MGSTVQVRPPTGLEEEATAQDTLPGQGAPSGTPPEGSIPPVPPRRELAPPEGGVEKASVKWLLAHVPWTIWLLLLTPFPTGLGIGYIIYSTLSVEGQATSVPEPAPSQTEQRVLETLRERRSSPTLAVEILMDVLEEQEDGSQEAYDTFVAVCLLIDQPSTSSDVLDGGDQRILRRFVLEVAEKPNTYETNFDRRRSDPGAYRHYVLAAALDRIAAGLDESQGTKRSVAAWAFHSYVRFLGNINAPRLKGGGYTPTVSGAVAQALRRVEQLHPEFFSVSGSISRDLKSAVSARNFNWFLGLNIGSRATGPRLLDQLGLQEHGLRAVVGPG